MAQPFDRSTVLPALGPLHKELGQFWLPNPSLFPQGRHNLSAYERNRTFLNSSSGRFRDASYLCGSDSDGDGRSAVAGDFNEDGRMDLLVRQVGGGPLLYFENRFARRHWLAVSLRGTRSNSNGIGARLELDFGDQRAVRDMYPANSFKSRSPNVVHFGLGQQSHARRLTIRWPSGLVQEFNDLAADQHVFLTEGKASIDTLAAQ